MPEYVTQEDFDQVVGDLQRTTLRLTQLEERVRRVEGFCASLREGFPQLVNVVSYETLKEAADVLGPISGN